MRSFTPQATPVAGAALANAFAAEGSGAPPLMGPILILTPEGEVEIHEGVAVVGRSPDCDVPLRDDLASRVHARIVLSRAGASIEDLSSTNGLYVNGCRLNGSRLLHEGDRVLVGTTELSVFGLRRLPVSGGNPRA
jgi:pSer/pThr/pTyr-binding forkhead associated (FHA) protein